MSATSGENVMGDLNFTDFYDGIIRLTPFSQRHITEKYVSWLNDPVVVRYSEQRHCKHTLQTCRDYFLLQKNSRNLFLAIEHDDFGHVGNIGVRVDINNNAADLSIIIGDQQVWGKGVGSRAWMASLKILIETLGFRVVTAGAMEVNEPMIKLMKASGMQIQGIIPRRFLWEGFEVGMVIGSMG
jgi:RimJ/RimL family protein N-acetyltransferase